MRALHGEEGRPVCTELVSSGFMSKHCHTNINSAGQAMAARSEPK